VDQDWLASYAVAFRQWPNTSVFGGPIRPWYDGSPPRWLQQVIHEPRVANVFGIRDYGTEAIPLSQTVLVYGANMATRASDQRKYLYDPSLGPRPNSALRGEEVDVVRRMLAEGAEGRWVPDAFVRHFIPKDHQTTRYLLSYFRGVGELRARSAGENRGMNGRGTVPLFANAVFTDLKYRIRRVTSSPEVWVNNLIRCGLAWGQVIGS
jgi:glucosyl-dolichyl phosphate glucuronosyltransferase